MAGNAEPIGFRASGTDEERLGKCRKDAYQGTKESRMA